MEIIKQQKTPALVDSFLIADVFKNLIESKKEYEITKEQEITKRLKIESDLKVALYSINAKKEIISQILSQSYNLRKENIDKMFFVIERALDENKNDIVVSALNNIEEILKDNPLKSLLHIHNTFEDDEQELII